MKSKLLILLASSFLLVGCGQSSGESQSKETSSSMTSQSESLSSEEKSSEPISTEEESSIEESKEGESSEEESSEESSEETIEDSSEELSSEEISSEEESSLEESSEEESIEELSSEEESSEESLESSEEEQSKEQEVNTLTVNFLNNGFTTGGLDNSAIQEKFVTSFNQESDLLKSATATGTNLVQIASIDSEVDYIKTILQIGSRSDEGALTLEFNYEVVAIEATVQAYWKSFQYSGTPLTYNIDNYANVSIGEGNYIELSNEKWDEEPDLVTRTFEFEGVKTVKLFNEMNIDDLPNKQGQRAFIHSLSISYIK